MHFELILKNIKQIRLADKAGMDTKHENMLDSHHFVSRLFKKNWVHNSSSAYDAGKTAPSSRTCRQASTPSTLKKPQFPSQKQALFSRFLNFTALR